MTEERKPIVALLCDSHGQSWVETVVMLPVIVALLLGLFYLHDLVTTRIRAIEAARFVTWESVWYGREDHDDRKMLPDTQDQNQWKQRLASVGLGFGLKNVDVFKRSLKNYGSDVGAGVEPTFFVPAAMSNVIGDTFGGDQSNNFISGIADSLSGVLNGLSGLVGNTAFFFQDLMAQNTNWDTEMNDSVYTTRVIYKFGYTGFFANLGTSTIVQRASVLSHPYVLRRTDDEKEYTELLGNACDSLFSSTNGHVVKLWLIPSGGVPPISGFDTSANDVVNGIIGKVGDAGKCIISGPGGLLKMLDGLLGSKLGFTMPDGTLKEYPELNMPASTGVSSGDGSGGGLGGCQPGGGGAMGSSSGFSGCP